MRIISGKYGGNRLKGPKGDKIRPTSDRVKEAIYSFLSTRFDFNAISVLDLFSGSGSLGIESLSRGAASLTLVEKSREGIRIIKQNLDKLNQNYNLFQGDVFRFIEHATQQNNSFNLILCDPPYDFHFHDKLLHKIANSLLLKPDGWLVYEHSSRLSLFPIDQLLIISQKKMGDTAVTFLKREKLN